VSTLEDWIQAATTELGIEVADDATTLVLDLARDVAHGVARPAAPVTAYLLGLAAGRADDPAAASRELAERLSTMAKSW
jgi:uncharacterized protein DUF6457